MFVITSFAPSSFLTQLSWDVWEVDFLSVMRGQILSVTLRWALWATHEASAKKKNKTKQPRDIEWLWKSKLSPAADKN